IVDVVSLAVISLALSSVVWTYWSLSKGMLRFSSAPLELRPYYEDPFLGLRPIGSLALSLATVYFGFIALFMLSLLTSSSTPALGHRGLRDRVLALTYRRPGLPHLSETPGAGSGIYSSLGPQSGRGHAALMPRRRLPGGTRMAGGEVVIETFDSQVLKGNPLKDPTRRDVAIYLPPKYDPRKR